VINHEKMPVEIDEDWEEWDPAKAPFYVHLIAGSFAGAAEHLVVFPFDTVKTFLQVEGSKGRTELRELLRTQGVTRLWRGVSTALMGCIPAHAGYFSIYEWGKVNFGANGPNHAPLAAAATGALATVAHDAVMSPMDVVKQRLQLGFHKNVFQAFGSIYRTEGPIALFRSFPTTLAMNMPFAAASIAANESLRKVLNPSGEFSLSTFVLSGFFSGAVAGFATTPLDVIRTRLNVQDLYLLGEKPTAAGSSHTSRFASRLNHGGMPSALLSSARKLSGNVATSIQATTQRHPSYSVARLKYTSPIRCPLPIALWASPGTSTLTTKQELGKILEKKAEYKKPVTHVRYTGPLQAAQSIWVAEGYRGFFRGAHQRMAVMAPGFAISWTAYESAKAVLLRE